MGKSKFCKRKKSVPNHFVHIVEIGGNLGELKLVLSAIEPSLRRYGHCPRVEKMINNNPLDSRLVKVNFAILKEKIKSIPNQSN